MGTLSNLMRKVAFHSLLFVAVWSFGPANDIGGATPEPATYVVVIKDFRFIPETLTVNAGDTIVWKNEDRAPHTATAQGVFDSKTIPHGKAWTLVAEGKGTFNYICTLHPRMKATLIVH